MKNRKNRMGLGAALLVALLGVGAVAQAEPAIKAVPVKPTPAAAEQTVKAVAPAGAQVNINKADAVTIADGLNGVGARKAEAIVAWRTANGPFTSLDQLQEVKGIGPAIVAKNKDLITLN